MKDLGPLHYFLGIQVHRIREGFFLHRQQYAEDILQRAGMSNCKPAPTPVDTKAKVSASSSQPVEDATFYRSIAGALQYLTLTRPELAAAELRSVASCDPFSKNCTLAVIRQASSSVIISQQSISLVTQCIMSERSMSSWIFTLYARRRCWSSPSSTCLNPTSIR